MKPIEPSRLVASHGDLFRSNGATAVFMYGSRARGEHRVDSDVDLFIDFDPAKKVPSLFKLIEIEEALSNTLGYPVSITTRDALHPLMKNTIEAESIRIV